VRWVDAITGKRSMSARSGTFKTGMRRAGCSTLGCTVPVAVHEVHRCPGR
jgi:hypothetical protein